jgi:hypothetical protein
LAKIKLTTILILLFQQISTMTLEARFIEFVRSLKNADIIDDLELNDQQMEGKKADFFFYDRQIIGEMKYITKDMKPKAKAILNRHKNKPDYPLFFGSRDSNKILDNLRNGEKIKENIFREITSAVKGYVKKANEQIRNTKTTFNLSDSNGILIILNDSVEILSPDLLCIRINELFNEKSQTGESCYPNISVVLIISEIHALEIADSEQKLSLLISVIDGSLTDYQEVRDYVEWLKKKWALFNNLPLCRTNIESVLSGNLVSLKNDDNIHSSNFISCEQAFINQYRLTPYLRGVSEEELMNHGQKIWYESHPFYLKGTHNKPSEERNHKLIELGIHFNEEMNYRGIDYRVFLPYLQDAYERLRLEGVIKTHE